MDITPWLYKQAAKKVGDISGLALYDIGLGLNIYGDKGQLFIYKHW